MKRLTFLFLNLFVALTVIISFVLIGCSSGPSQKEFELMQERLEQYERQEQQQQRQSQPTPVPAPTASPQNSAPNGFVRINGGTFQMGSSDGNDNEKPVHTVTVSSFYMGRYEVTQKEWTTVMGNNPSKFEGDNLPVGNISWYNAIVYCNRRSEREGLTSAYTISDPDPVNEQRTIVWNKNANGYRLPTEAEWEYAAKGGNGSPGNFTFAGSNNADEVSWYYGNSGNRPHTVGTKKPNGLGLYDMCGNMAEWCWDRYGSYSSEAQTDPTGATSGVERVERGGDFMSGIYNEGTRYFRSASRRRSVGGMYGFSSTYGSSGFRIVRNL